jgi:hypothetical protein
VLSGVIFIIVVMAVMLVVGETVMRYQGKRPGYVGVYSKYKPSEGLVDKKMFHTDNEGVFKATPENRMHQYNSDGFRGREFKPVDEKALSVFFLGDSFTWGGAASPMTESFVDRTAASGYVTFNAGIPGTDLAQYAFLAEKYVPILKPDVVAVMFCMANDLNGPLPMVPNENLYYYTNRGFIYAYDKYGAHLSLEDADAQQRGVLHPRLTTTPGYESAQGFLMKTVLGTYLWVYMTRVMPSLEVRVPERGAHVGRHLERIRTAAENGNARFMLFLLPAHPDLKRADVGIEENIHRFEGFGPRYPKGLASSDYMPLPDGHYNNSGHRKYADFIVSTLEAEGLRPSAR